MTSGDFLWAVFWVTLGLTIVGVAWAHAWQKVSYDKYATQRAKWEADAERQLGHALWPDDPEGKDDE